MNCTLNSDRECLKVVDTFRDLIPDPAVSCNLLLCGENNSPIALRTNRTCLAATPTFCELIFILLSTTATPNFPFNRI